MRRQQAKNGQPHVQTFSCLGPQPEQCTKLGLPSGGKSAFETGTDSWVRTFSACRVAGSGGKHEAAALREASET